MHVLSSLVARLGDTGRRNQIYALKEFLRAQPRPILIYQMAKVGSTSVYESMRQAGLHPLHVHQISASRTSGSVAFYEEQGIAPTIDVFVGRLLHPYLRLTSHRIKVVSLVRDPVARYLSKLFHVPQAYDVVSSNVEQTRRAITEMFSNPATFESGMFTWFDRELKAQLEVDVMAQEFDRERGYSVYAGPRCDVLVLKLERLSDLLPTAVSEFVGVPLQDVRANVGSGKKSADAYARVKQALQLPAPVLDRIYGHQWVRHFYTDAEIAAFRARWA